MDDEQVTRVMEALRYLEAHGSSPPLNRPPPSATPSSMSPTPKADWEPRVGRLEMGFCVAFLILSGLIGGLYFYFNGRFDTLNEKITAIQVQSAQTNGKIDLLLERTAPKK